MRFLSLFLQKYGSWIATGVILIVVIGYLSMTDVGFGFNKPNITIRTIADPGIVSLKTAEFYRNLTPRNRVLRATCSPKYRMPTDTETSRLNPLFLQAMQLCQWKLPYHSGEEPQWIIAESATEGGMPHTLSRYIILPEGCWESYSSEEIVHLFVHELCHIHQRQYPREWNKMYQSNGFETYSSWVILPNQRMNPDTIQHGMWSYDGMIPVEIFRKDATTIRDTDLFWKPVSIKSIQVADDDADDDADDTKKLRRDFPFISQIEHPNEIYACMIAEDIVPLTRRESHPQMSMIRKTFLQE